ncbi:TadE/TadG family type IV pilus assembly protein [Mesorhizobium sp. M3A.F.Ca.ET.080.04.2.1]|uniref:TadE/TadG family type IV pilus assembly protein n=1 Tax=Mesorhizobium sp. M3A.F.Ca.ET.080.04.2.1 TaxID=2493676 RepID=UPI001FDEEC2A|nr:TadE/TadG family type IV pilus assembly protein [Mesorhizobium sp. M3A.F.Ca.ET.080.04.2.1]
MSNLLSRIVKRFRSDQHGTVLVEMTLVAPLMLLLSAGVFEFGNLIHDKLLMEAGLTDGARFAARCNSKLYADATPLARSTAPIAPRTLLSSAIGMGQRPHASLAGKKRTSRSALPTRPPAKMRSTPAPAL